MRYLLDTDIISNVTKPSPSPTLLTWMAEQDDDDLFIASLTVAEIRRVILEKPAGKRRDELEDWFVGPEGPLAGLEARSTRSFPQWPKLITALSSRVTGRTSLASSLSTHFVKGGVKSLIRRVVAMLHITKVFQSGNFQAVRLQRISASPSMRSRSRARAMP